MSKTFQSAVRLRLGLPGQYIWTGAAGSGNLQPPNTVRNKIGQSNMGPIFFKNQGTGAFTINGSSLYGTAAVSTYVVPAGAAVMLIPGISTWGIAVMAGA